MNSRIHMRAAAKFGAIALMAYFLNACGSPYYTSDPIEAWVIDDETGKPIEGAIVTANWQLVAPTLDSGVPGGQLEVMETATDKNGRFFFPGFTKINLRVIDELRTHDPGTIIFKPGYKWIGLSSEYPAGKTPGAHRKSL